MHMLRFEKKSNLPFSVGFVVQAPWVVQVLLPLAHLLLQPIRINKLLNIHHI